MESMWKPALNISFISSTVPSWCPCSKSYAVKSLIFSNNCFFLSACCFRCNLAFSRWLLDERYDSRSSASEMDFILNLFNLLTFTCLSSCGPSSDVPSRSSSIDDGPLYSSDYFLGVLWLALFFLALSSRDSFYFIWFSLSEILRSTKLSSDLTSSVLTPFDRSLCASTILPLLTADLAVPVFETLLSLSTTLELAS